MQFESGRTASCNQNITVTDNEVPVINCNADIVTNNDAGSCGAIVALTAPLYSDNCAGAMVSNNAPVGNYFPTGTTVIVWTVKDAAGNTATCNQLVTVKDNEKPVITCGANKTLTSEAGKCGAMVVLTPPLVSDNCGGVMISNNAPADNFFKVGTTIVTWIATDAAGNIASCDQAIMVTDIEKPAIHCVADMVVNPTSATGAIVKYDNPVASDNCGILSLIRTAGPASGANFKIGTTTVSFKATDMSGNINTCSFNVTVNDPYKSNNKLYVCHFGTTLTVNTNELQTHLSHGDKIGPCFWTISNAPMNVRVEQETVELPVSFSLAAYPNPFTKSTSISYGMPVGGTVSLKLFDGGGREIMTLVNKEQDAGMHSVELNASTLTAGVYYYTLNVYGNGKDYKETKRLMIIK